MRHRSIRSQNGAKAVAMGAKRMIAADGGSLADRAAPAKDVYYVFSFIHFRFTEKRSECMLVGWRAKRVAFGDRSRRR